MRLVSKLIILTATFIVALSSVPALAVSGNSRVSAEDSSVITNTTTETENTTESNNNGAEKSTKGAEKKAAAQEKAAAAKLKACQKKEKHITATMARIADRGQKQLDLFSTIATKVEAFYAEKGKTLSNYDALVADVTEKKATAQTAVDGIKATTVTFTCDGTDPKGAATVFKESLKSEIAALKAYKTSVKNLIVGVKSVQSTDKATENHTTEGAQL